MTGRIDKTELLMLAAQDPLRAFQCAGLKIAKIRRSGTYIQVLCPLHPDKDSPSFTIYPTGRFHCFGCGAHGDILQFYQSLHQVDFSTACTQLGQQMYVLAPLEQSPAPSLIQPVPPQKLEPDFLPSGLIAACHQQLMQDDKRLQWLTVKKALRVGTIKDAQLGVGKGPCWSGLRYTIPIPELYDTDLWRDMRGYSPQQTPKMLPWEKGRGRARVYGWPWVSGSSELVWVEGELDALNLIAHGVAAVTTTCGAKAATSASLVLPDLTGKTIRLLFDADEAGRTAARDFPARLIAAGAAKVTRLDWPAEVPPGFDISDFLAAGGDLGELGL